MLAPRRIEPRLPYAELHRLAPAIGASLRALDEAALRADLDPVLLELMKLRVSQLNGCAFCLQYHTNDLAKRQADPAKLVQVAAWREASVFDEAERAALDYAEALTRLDAHGVPDAVYAAAERAFGAERLPALAAAVVAINGWNRVAIGFRFTPPPAGVRA